MDCKNDPNKKYTGNEPSPKGFGYCAHSEKVGVSKRGKDGKVWIVKKYGKVNRWVISDYYKKYKKSLDKLKNLLGKSIVEFNIVSFEEIIKKNKDWFVNNDFFPEIMIEFNFDEVGKLFGNIEFKRCACESEFYKYVIDTGSDIGIKHKQLNTQTYFYDIDDEFKEWKNFKKECKVYNKNNIKYLKEIWSQIPKKYIKYIKKKYKLDHL